MLAEGPGSMALFLAAHLPAANGVVTTLETTNSLWTFHPTVHQHPRLRVAKAGTGDIITNPIEILNACGGPGIHDLVVADGGVHTDGGGIRKEDVSIGLWQAEAFVGTALLVNGGDLVLKVGNTLSTASADMLWRLACCFERVVMTHGALVRPNNQERYMVCIGKYQEFAAGPEVSHALADQVTAQAFGAFMMKQNNRSLEMQSEVYTVQRVCNELDLKAVYDPLPGVMANLMALS